MKRRALSLAPALALSLAACSGDGETETVSPSTGPGGGDEQPPPFVPAAHSWAECQASDQAFVRRVIAAIAGRRPWGQAEVNAFEDAIREIRAADRAGGFSDFAGALPPEGGDLERPKELVVRAIMDADGYFERWSDFFMDALHVSRVEVKRMEGCYGVPPPAAIDDGGLARYVRDNGPEAAAPPIAGFTLGELLSSSLALDDLSPLYRAHLFALISLPIPGANVGPLELEKSRRHDFGAIFEAAYLHRDPVCLGCHNSEFSVTFDDDTSKNRYFPLPGLFELALYGSSNGKHPPEDAATKGTDALRARSMLRYEGVVDVGETAPYGANAACGLFSRPTTADSAGVDAFFGSIRSTPELPDRGRFASVYDLEAALHRGVDLLAAHGLRRSATGELADADEAFAYLVAANVAEQVHKEVTGTPLTIANYFPRTAVQRDLLMSLTEHFVLSRFSLKTLLLDIVAEPTFNLRAPDEGCGAAAYELPPVFDPWTSAEADLARRPNAPGDGVFAVSSRPLRRALHRAMEWPAFGTDVLYPGGAEEELQTAIGHFLKDGEPGFRGLDFQGRLTWESTYGTCPSTGASDYVTKVVAEATAQGATIGDAVAALKDRLVGDPTVEPAAERPAIEALFGASLDATDLGGLDGKLRALCGVLVASPQHMLGGVVPPDTRVVAKLNAQVKYRATCEYIESWLARAGEPYVVECHDDSMRVTR